MHEGASNTLALSGLALAPLLALAVIALELGASVMILTGFFRWQGALALGAFTRMSTSIALR
ncbi:DoxX family membrane protein [Mesorhizobium neociceri]|uniref:DoxX family membrane protein n=1 Tax=Mesorhizobium neociceri TaxID=1307853 RepID=UPI002E2DAFD7|nr:DoxX family membrane protein [Mesorhizobium neociceri]